MFLRRHSSSEKMISKSYLDGTACLILHRRKKKTPASVIPDVDIVTSKQYKYFNS